MSFVNDLHIKLAFFSESFRRIQCPEVEIDRRCNGTKGGRIIPACGPLFRKSFGVDF